MKKILMTPTEVEAKMLVYAIQNDMHPGDSYGLGFLIDLKEMIDLSLRDNFDKGIVSLVDKGFLTIYRPTTEIKLTLIGHEYLKHIPIK
ncbi:hypothetical protein [Mucilaginibacter polytrichastri]|uniref:hypothetical protein n=1 Tax=Mucilaginibacter polytrichastri TaxID=1302689 RepID=UPI0008EFE9E8|nr:hypothetical protein [Mucilaginibacter polytrichastri]SFT08635.1 hypothetical protein SAMN04487890_11046 [Mucilaginibacter polytrichastri]